MNTLFLLFLMDIRYITLILNILIKNGELMIIIENLSKEFIVKKRKETTIKKALNDISLILEKGKTIGLIGANGSGKSTLIKTLVSLYHPTEGKVFIDGVNVHEEKDNLNDNIGVLYGGDAGLYERLTARENIAYFGELNGVHPEVVNTSINHYSYIFNMGEYIDRKVAKFSRGMRQKVCFVRSIIHDPDLIILDEPSTGLDVQGLKEVSDFIKYNQEKGKTIIISSHNMNEIVTLCDQVIILKDGSLSYFGDLTPLIKENNDISEIYNLMGVKA